VSEAQLRRAGFRLLIHVGTALAREFIVVICGDNMTMPGLPKVPSAEVIGLDEKGQIAGLF
jgi:formyltetrahydrofolate synthetase